MLRIVYSWVFVCLLLGTTESARAHDTYVVHGTQIVEQDDHARARRRYGHDYVRRPSIFKYSYQSFVAGAVAGLGVGYLTVRRDGVNGDDWRGLAFGAGVGALTGATLGLTLGLLDRSGAATGHYVGRDMSYGVALGALIGATAGGLSSLLSADAEHVLFGTAVGAVTGIGLGIVTGLLEGQLRDEELVTSGSRRLRVSAVRPSGSKTWVAALSGSF